MGGSIRSLGFRIIHFDSTLHFRKALQPCPHTDLVLFGFFDVSKLTFRREFISETGQDVKQKDDAEAPPSWARLDWKALRNVRNGPPELFLKVFKGDLAYGFPLPTVVSRVAGRKNGFRTEQDGTKTVPPGPRGRVFQERAGQGGRPPRRDEVQRSRLEAVWLVPRRLRPPLPPPTIKLAQLRTPWQWDCSIASLTDEELPKSSAVMISFFTMAPPEGSHPILS